MSIENFGESQNMSNVVLAAHLAYGRGGVGLKNPLDTPEAEQEYARNLEAFKRPLTVFNSLDCMEDRWITSLADGTTDPAELAKRVAYQGPGGLGLWLTKAASGADLAIIRDADGLQSAYQIIVNMIEQLGFEDSAHADCGASKGAEKSVANSISEDDLMAGGLAALTNINDQAGYYYKRNQETKRRRLEAGYYGKWSTDWHAGFVADKFPHNFADIHVDTSDPETHGGHLASGVFVIEEKGVGFAKNAFHDATGGTAFGLTPKPAIEHFKDLIHAMTGSDEERGRFLLELGSDTAHVSAGLVKPDFPAFLAAA